MIFSYQVTKGTRWTDGNNPVTSSGQHTYRQVWNETWKFSYTAYVSISFDSSNKQPLFPVHLSIDVPKVST